MNRRSFLKLGLAVGASAYIAQDRGVTALDVVEDKNVVSAEHVNSTPQQVDISDNMPSTSVGYKFPTDAHVGDLHIVNKAGLFAFNGVDWIYVNEVT